ncbi:MULTISPECIES: TetR/AcrR family transcriptional regulator [unclassified Crossiella]|uniref:TetR/AcrR family transcriptional regulator n=1 Tax=unclassified Crossiella TaxID=2620835 RepID=UPI001FFFC354|nr:MULTISPECIES: TetR/AcrR family transcriptional regulator [unclassified Crossiella]MCK2242622.1 TetR/AcrR family transcriptional regulator [Crossiella sp. S99.2]MCK2256499.1 TetR/AcrR family transcriptional regulator [Crossiella sp. S99.1]
MTTTDRPPGLRERKRQETHRTIALTALRLIAERGLDHVTVEDIAGEVGVSSRTFFNYFGSKEDALSTPYPDHRHRIDRLVERLAETPVGPDPLAGLLAIARPDLARIDADRDEWLLRMTVFTDNPQLLARTAVLESAGEQQLTEAIARWCGLPADDQYPALVLYTFGAAGRSAMRRWYAVRGAEPLVDLVDAACAALAAGLPLPADATPRG